MPYKVCTQRRVPAPDDLRKYTDTVIEEAVVAECEDNASACELAAATQMAHPDSHVWVEPPEPEKGPK